MGLEPESPWLVPTLFRYKVAHETASTDSRGVSCPRLASRIVLFFPV